MNIAHEIELLVREIKRLGTENAEGDIIVKFGVLFSDDHCANIFEALVGTLRAAKRKNIIDFKGEMLLQGVHDDVDIILLKEKD
ncbi:costars family protein ABRACL [Pholidichthys leucotaenia]